MGKCNLCGKKVQPYIEICADCSTTKLGFSMHDNKFEFMKNMGIRW